MIVMHSQSETPGKLTFDIPIIVLHDLTLYASGTTAINFFIKQTLCMSHTSSTSLLYIMSVYSELS